MKYIESKPNGDGTYDHAEVREAWSGLSPIYARAVHKGIEFEWEKLYLNNPSWYADQQYRVSVPDTYGIHESSSTLSEGGPAVAEMLLDRIKELEEALIDLIKFAEGCDMQIESEWGSYCGSLSDMYDRGLVSEEILAARAALNKEQK